MKWSLRLRLKREKVIVRFKTWFPLVSKKIAFAEKQKALQELGTRNALELEKEHTRVDKLIGELTQLTWYRDGADVYRCQFGFDARIMYGYRDRENQQFIAQMMARQVEHEIASSRFVQKAEENRYSVPNSFVRPMQ